MVLLSRCSQSVDLVVGGWRGGKVGWEAASVEGWGGEGGRRDKAMNVGEFWQKAFEVKKSE